MARTESKHWIEGYERVAEMAAAMPATRRECVAEREAELLAIDRIERARAGASICP